ncbi:hypothetical protein [Gemmata massiliana]|uniref:hypothetical protein n=1 Tax=Gemmata massiliana TaxID=1210884 RepID=UPI0013A6FC90|nr:hypothetical protein [Gemmata massiliana]
MEPDPYFIQALISTPWLRHCGESITLDVEYDSAQVSSWAEAAGAYTADWENLKHEQFNDTIFKLSSRNQREISHWSGLLRKVKQLVDEHLSEPVSTRILGTGLNHLFIDTIKFDVYMAGMEFTFANSGCNLHRFYRSIFSVYSTGHWPCGWDGGKYPNGFLVLF